MVNDLELFELQAIICQYCGEVSYFPKELCNKIGNTYGFECKKCKKITNMIFDGKEYKNTPKFAWDTNTPPVMENLFQTAILLTPKNGTILELGSGTTTEEFAKYRNIYSIEHNEGFVGRYNNKENYIYAPLANDWYDKEIVINSIKNVKYNVLLIDGTDLDNRYEKFNENIDIFDKSVPWILDDLEYDPFKKDIERLFELRSDSEPIIFTGIKDWCIIPATNYKVKL